MRKRIAEVRRLEPWRYFFVFDPMKYYSCVERFESVEEIHGYFGQEKKPSPNIYCFSLYSDLAWDAAFAFVGIWSGATAEPPRPLNPSAVVVDELKKFADSKSGLETFTGFVEYGRHAILDLFYCSMMPVDVPSMIKQNANRYYVWRQGTERNTKALSEITVIGDEAFELDGLGKYEFRIFPEEKIPKVSSRNADTYNKEGGRDEDRKKGDVQGGDVLGRDPGDKKGGGGVMGGGVPEKKQPGGPAAGGGVGG